MPEIQRVWHANRPVHGTDQVWRLLNCEGLQVARHSVERLPPCSRSYLDVAQTAPAAPCRASNGNSRFC